MTNLHIYDAFDAEDSFSLEDFVKSCGYTQKMTPLTTKLMNARPVRFFERDKEGHLEFNENNRQEESIQRHYFVITQENAISLNPLTLMFRNPMPASLMYSQSARQNWNSKYIDEFTYYKEDTDVISFVDCFRKINRSTGEAGRLILLSGKFKQYLDFDDKKYDKETNMMLNLANLREHYPPMNALEIILGPNPEWVVAKTFGAAAIFAASFASAYKASHEFAIISSSAVTVALEGIIHLGLYRSNGAYRYNRQEVKVNEKAISFLLNHK